MSPTSGSVAASWPLNAASWVPPIAMGLIGKTGGSFTFATVTLSVAVADSPPASVTLTVKAFRPSSALRGVPPSAPAAETVSHDGPETFEYVSVSPTSGSVAASWPLNAASWVPPIAMGLIGKTGGLLNRVYASTRLLPDCWMAQVPWPVVKPVVISANLAGSKPEIAVELCIKVKVCEVSLKWVSACSLMRMITGFAAVADRFNALIASLSYPTPAAPVQSPTCQSRTAPTGSVSWPLIVRTPGPLVPGASVPLLETWPPIVPVPASVAPAATVTAEPLASDPFTVNVPALTVVVPV